MTLASDVGRAFIHGRTERAQRGCGGGLVQALRDTPTAPVQGLGEIGQEVHRRVDLRPVRHAL